MPKKEKVKGKYSQASLATKRVNFFHSKKKNCVQNQDNFKDENNASNDSDDLIESLENNVQVGAFAIAGFPGGTLDVDETDLPDSRLSMTQQSQDAASVNITSARVVSDVIVDATPVEGNATPLEGVSKKGLILRYTLIAIVSLLLLIAIIIPTIILTRQSPNDSTDDDSATNATSRSAQENELLQNLKRHLSNASFQELESPYSMQSLALDWLLNSSTFGNYSSDRQLQRFAMALVYFSTEGRSWNVNQDWLSDEDECSWYQNHRGSRNSCLNGTLLVLSLDENDLKGFLPNDIALLNSLTYLDLHSNSLTGSIPSEIGAITTLQVLDLSLNSLTGYIPSEIGALTTLEWLDLSYNSLTGSIPSEIGVLTRLTELYLSYNSLTGSIPESFCNQGLYLGVDETVTCSCCL